MRPCNPVDLLILHERNLPNDLNLTNLSAERMLLVDLVGILGLGAFFAIPIVLLPLLASFISGCG